MSEFEQNFAPARDVPVRRPTMETTIPNTGDSSVLPEAPFRFADTTEPLPRPPLAEKTVLDACVPGEKGSSKKSAGKKRGRNKENDLTDFVVDNSDEEIAEKDDDGARPTKKKKKAQSKKDPKGKGKSSETAEVATTSTSVAAASAGTETYLSRCFNADELAIIFDRLTLFRERETQLKLYEDNATVHAARLSLEAEQKRKEVLRLELKVECIKKANLILEIMSKWIIKNFSNGDRNVPVLRVVGKGQDCLMGQRTVLFGVREGRSGGGQFGADDFKDASPGTEDRDKLCVGDYERLPGFDLDTGMLNTQDGEHGLNETVAKHLCGLVETVRNRCLADMVDDVALKAAEEIVPRVKVSTMDDGIRERIYAVHGTRWQDTGPCLGIVSESVSGGNISLTGNGLWDGGDEDRSIGAANPGCETGGTRSASVERAFGID
ncbi:hypothetical protein SISSUDRAFT_1032793 [Sistotremastrum suecicum HHB10207 ss-3]|uniref:Uncharacterized protein n=1 Tax=Sistotremastrum suecicum HHB10207 ss-3 TaxID=1314776 RepID=A0A166E692_9AGAM|nr:hypothetical protein SISSUDRAFT_1032793 [Sistotremastrum suecicum HHB10207 ss-3]